MLLHDEASNVVGVSLQRWCPWCDLYDTTFQLLFDDIIIFFERFWITTKAAKKRGETAFRKLIIFRLVVVRFPWPTYFISSITVGD